MTSNDLDGRSRADEQTGNCRAGSRPQLWSGWLGSLTLSLHTCRSEGEADGRRHDALQVVLHLTACSTQVLDPLGTPGAATKSLSLPATI